jgi:pantoate--beta-alanine ligase
VTAAVARPSRRGAGRGSIEPAPGALLLWLRVKIATKQAEMAALSRRWLARGETIGFVPTMGALHEGHASLIRRARQENRRVVVSIFVNPAQFGPTEDFSRYPRTFAADAGLCKAEGADAVYHPGVEEVYPPGFSTFVDPGPLAQPLDGRFRPGHFRGVATVVAKLLNTVRPTRAYFGEKDFQQLAVIRRMTLDLDLGVAIEGCATVREPDGLALSSRNIYLSPAERRASPAIHETLRLAARLLREGKTPKAALAQAARHLRKHLPEAKVDYLELVDAATLQPLDAPAGRMRLLAAVRVGKTRLIDNIAA